jgi:CRP-like cAMP-binding protein
MRLKEGQFFGESALKDDEEQRVRQAAVVAVGPVRVGQLKRGDFQQILGSLTEVMARNFNRKVVEAVDLLKSLQISEKEVLLEILEESSFEVGTHVLPPPSLSTIPTLFITFHHCLAALPSTRSHPA